MFINYASNYHMNDFINSIQEELQTLKEKRNFRSLPQLIHNKGEVVVNGQRMLNLSSNDYLGLSNDLSL